MLFLTLNEIQHPPSLHHQRMVTENTYSSFQSFSPLRYTNRQRSDAEMPQDFASLCIVQPGYVGGAVGESWDGVVGFTRAERGQRGVLAAEVALGVFEARLMVVMPVGRAS